MELKHNHTNFLIEMLGRLGPPIFAATLVGCLLADRMIPSHLILMGIGIAFIALHHWFTFHSKHKS